ncbi:hypothetical protein [Streptomyces sp. NPDC057877]|uniref:hypothetical protein n=1 Tax=Streptomyces sp. NPDC057877 TaxID=3346269 RepID=UPI0036889285
MGVGGGGGGGAAACCAYVVAYDRRAYWGHGHGDFDTRTAMAVGVSPDDVVLARVDPDKLGPEAVRELFREP